MSVAEDLLEDGEEGDGVDVGGEEAELDGVLEGEGERERREGAGGSEMQSLRVSDISTRRPHTTHNTTHPLTRQQDTPQCISYPEFPQPSNTSGPVTLHTNHGSYLHQRGYVPRHKMDNRRRHAVRVGPFYRGTEAEVNQH